MSEYTEEAAKGTSFLLGQSAASGFFRILNIMILARLLLQSEIGQIALMSIIYGFTQFLGALGLNHASPLIIPAEEKAGRLDRVKGFLKRSTLLIMFSSFLLIVLLIVISPLIVGTGTLTQTTLDVLVIIIPFSALETFLDSFLLGRYSVKRLAASRIIFDITRLAATVFLVFMGLGIIGVAVGWLLSEIVAVCVFGISSTRGLGKTSSTLEIRPILAFALPSLLFQFLDVTIQNTDRIVLLILSDLVALAVYDVILGILFMMSFVSLAIASALYPVLTRYRLQAEEGNNTDNALGHAVSTLARYVLILLLPISLIAALNSQAILTVLFGASYGLYPYAALSFSLLVISYSLWGLTYALHSVLRSMGETRFFVISGISIIGFEIVGCWLLTSILGLLGSAIIRCIYILMLFLAAWGRLKQRGLSWARSTVQSSGVIMLASILTGLLVLLLNPINMIGLIGAVLLSIPLYVFLLLLAREVTSMDFQIVKSILPRPIHQHLDKFHDLYKRWAE
ncbi:MAG: oligosaccharide flippase family protein [Candidatus Thorarchaeota archaeon]|nr:oligosaccharide flippase family protein [Candidatus Thorarchaeota archaeon]